MSEAVNHPNHYADGKIEVIDFIEDKHLNFCLGNAVKYIARAGKKDRSKYVEDLEKAVWYLKYEIEKAEKKQTNAVPLSARACDTCKYNDLHVNDEPCRFCVNPAHSQWEAKE